MQIPQILKDPVDWINWHVRSRIEGYLQECVLDKIDGLQRKGDSQHGKQHISHRVGCQDEGTPAARPVVTQHHIHRRQISAVHSLT